MEDLGICKVCSQILKSFRNYDLWRVLAAYLTFVVCTIDARAAPLNNKASVPRWEHPCGGGLPAEGEGIFDVEGYVFDDEPLHLLYHDISQKSSLVKDKMRELKHKMIKERLSQTLAESLEAFNLVGMPHIPTIQEGIYEAKGNEKVYNDMARLAVFLEQARLDEDTHEPFTRSYQRHFEEIEEDIYWILCRLQTAMTQEKQTIVTVTADVMSMQLREVSDRMTRRQRDFLMLRDSAVVLHHVSYYYSDVSRKAQDGSYNNRIY